METSGRSRYLGEVVIWVNHLACMPPTEKLRLVPCNWYLLLIFENVQNCVLFSNVVILKQKHNFELWNFCLLWHLDEADMKEKQISRRRRHLGEVHIWEKQTPWRSRQMTLATSRWSIIKRKIISTPSLAKILQIAFLTHQMTHA